MKIKLQNPFLKILSTVLLVICIILSLLNSDYFYNAPALSYYGFCVTALLFTIIPIHSYHEKNKLTVFKFPILIFGLWSLYVIIHYFNDSSTPIFTIYSIVLYLFLLKATVLFKMPNFNFKFLFGSIAAIASIESIYCLFQFLGWFKSQSDFFRVTGSWNNPNVTAIFLALTTPIFLFFFQSKYKKIVLTGFFSLLIALILLKCRAAFIGALIASITFYCLKYPVIHWIKNKENRTSVKALIIIGLLIIIPIVSYLYSSKKDSADGRKFIWKLSTAMATEKPLIGYGYGFFEKEYNLYQANYIKNGNATAEELTNAGPVIMPHNELLLNTVEGGFIGLLLIIFFFGSLLFAIKRRKKNITNKSNIEIAIENGDDIFNLSYAGIVAFIGMSMVNSTIQVVPIMCLLVIYGAIICSSIYSIELPQFFLSIEQSKAFSIVYKILIMCVSLYLLFLIIGIATADRQNKKAELLNKTGHTEQALQMMPELETYLNDESYYWQNYGQQYYKKQDFQNATTCFKKAQLLSSLPEVYLGAGESYKKLKQYPQAIQEYETLIALYPSKFLYRMLLLETYLRNKDIAKAIVLAQKIIQMKSKIESEKVRQYKNMCQILLKKLAPQKIKNEPLQFQSFNSK